MAGPSITAIFSDYLLLSKQFWTLKENILVIVSPSVYIYIYIYCAVLKRLATPSDFHIPLPSIVPFANSETSFTHGCIYPIFPGSSGTTSFFRSFRFPGDHNFWLSHLVHSLNISVPNELFSGCVIQYRILRVICYLSVKIRDFCLYD
jgi:hypothetical protein